MQTSTPASLLPPDVLREQALARATSLGYLAGPYLGHTYLGPGPHLPRIGHSYLRQAFPASPSLAGHSHLGLAGPVGHRSWSLKPSALRPILSSSFSAEQPILALFLLAARPVLSLSFPAVMPGPVLAVPALLVAGPVPDLDVPILLAAEPVRLGGGGP